MKSSHDLSGILNQISGIQKKLDVDTLVSVYFGYSQEERIRLSFLSVKKPFKMESTRNIAIIQEPEVTGGFWTHFDLLDRDQKKVFLSFAQNMIDSVLYVTTEEQAFNALKHRYDTWKTMFKSNSNTRLSREIIQGVFGELYFLKEFMISKYGVDRAIQSWAGADGKSKDFSIDEQWFEIKTIGANSDRVHISSLTQLDSANLGRLVVLKVEAMSEEFSGENTSCFDLFDSIRSIITDEAVENVFYSKVASTAISASEEAFQSKFVVKDFLRYLVDDKFPRLTERTRPFAEICEAEYCLSLSALAKYKEQ